MRIKSHKTLYTYRLIVSGVKFVIVIPIKLAPCRMRMRIELALVYLMTLRLIKIIELLLFLMMTQSDYRANGLQFLWPTFRPSNRLRFERYARADTNHAWKHQWTITILVTKSSLVFWSDARRFFFSIRDLCATTLPPRMHAPKL